MQLTPAQTVSRAAFNHVRRFAHILSALALICLPVWFALSQTQKDAKPQDKNSEIKLGVDLVVLDALVLQQKTGRIIGNLKKDDFTLYEDGIKQQISHFSQDKLPLSVILMVDRAGCLDAFGKQVRQATVDALSKLKDEDEVAVMMFSDEVDLIQPFRYDKKRAIDALDQIPQQEDEDAGHCFNKAFYQAAKYMNEAANPAGRRVLIMITGITTDFSCKGISPDEVRNEIFESGTVVCGLIPASAGQHLESGIIRGATGVGKAFGAHTASLSQLAEETGGEVMNDKAENLDKTFGTLVDHLRTRYSIGFIPTNPKRDGTFRKLKLDLPPSVDAKYGKVVVKTRRGYIAGKAAGSSK